MIPCFAPIPFPTMIATGVASPKAQGQLITNTEMPLASANPKLCPTSSQMIIVGNGMGAKHGIMFKTAVSIEETGKTQIIALDKTGTIKVENHRLQIWYR